MMLLAVVTVAVARPDFSADSELSAVEFEFLLEGFGI